MLYTLKKNFSRNLIGVTCDEEADLRTLYWLLIRSSVFTNDPNAPENGWLDVMQNCSVLADLAARIRDVVYNPALSKTRPMRSLLEPKNIAQAYSVPIEHALFVSYFFGEVRIGGFDLSYKTKWRTVVERETADYKDWVPTGKQIAVAALAFKFFDEDFQPAFRECVAAARAQVESNSYRADKAVTFFDANTVIKVCSHFRTFCANVRDAAEGSGSIRYNYDVDYYYPHVLAAVCSWLFPSVQNEANQTAIARCEKDVDELLLNSNIVADVVAEVGAGKRAQLLKTQIADGLITKFAALLSTMRQAKLDAMPASTGAELIRRYCPTRVVDTKSAPQLVYDVLKTAKPIVHAASKTTGENGWAVRTKAYFTDSFNKVTVGVYTDLVNELNDLVTDIANASRGDALLVKSVAASILTRLRSLGDAVLLDFLIEKGGVKNCILSPTDGTDGIKYRAKAAWMSLSPIIGTSLLRPNGAIGEYHDLATVVLGILLLKPEGAENELNSTCLGALDSVTGLEKPEKEAPSMRGVGAPGSGASPKVRPWEYEWDYVSTLLKTVGSGLNLINVSEIHAQLLRPSAFAADGKLSYVATAEKYAPDSPLQRVSIADVWEHLGVYKTRFLILADEQMKLHASLLCEMIASVAAPTGATASGRQPTGTSWADDTYLWYFKRICMYAREQFGTFVYGKFLLDGVSFDEDRIENKDYAIPLNSAITCSCTRCLASVVSVINPDLGKALKHVLAAAERAGKRHGGAFYDVGTLSDILQH